MVALGVLSPVEAYASIDHDTIVLLFGMMLLTAELDEDFFDRLADRLAAHARTPAMLLVGISLTSGITAAVLVNDTICLLFTPAVVRLCVRHRLPTGAFLIALATSANIGSAATLVGNPQNMLIGSMSGIPFVTFLAALAPVTAIGLAANTAMLLTFYRRPLASASLSATVHAAQRDATSRHRRPRA
jgi:Na+/H+ antiporter NhaD/arsenite permease-like protein